MGKPTISIGANKDADQLRGYREADQRLCFRYSDSTIRVLHIPLVVMCLIYIFSPECTPYSCSCYVFDIYMYFQS